MDAREEPTRVPIWAEHTTRAGRVAYEYLDGGDSDDIVWLSAETAGRWLDQVRSTPRGLFMAKAASAALDYLGLEHIVEEKALTTGGNCLTL